MIAVLHKVTGALLLEVPAETLAGADLARAVQRAGAAIQAGEPHFSRASPRTRSRLSALIPMRVRSPTPGGGDVGHPAWEKCACE